jgi:hypothetical protein
MAPVAALRTAAPVLLFRYLNTSPDRPFGGGISLYVLQGLLGHSQARATQRHAHLMSDTLLDAAEVIRAVIFYPAPTLQSLLRSSAGARAIYGSKRHRHRETTVKHELKDKARLCKRCLDLLFCHLSRPG